MKQRYLDLRHLAGHEVMEFPVKKGEKRVLYYLEFKTQ